MSTWKSRAIPLPAVALALLMATAGPAAADRKPTTQERTRIETTLRQLGYEGWKEIELDDGRWEVDDARHADGKAYDLELDPVSLEVVTRRLDD